LSSNYQKDKTQEKLQTISLSHNREEIKSGKKIRIDIKDKASFKLIEQGFKVNQKYEIIAPSDDPKKTKPKLKFVANFGLVFSSEQPINRKFFDVFQMVNLHLNSWPYFREFTHNMVQRMNLPPLILPFVRRH
jgi:hypothetical protein